MPDGTTRFSMLDGTPIYHFMGCFAFANHTVVPVIALAKVRKDALFAKICYIGCGVTTGIGVVINTAKAAIYSMIARKLTLDEINHGFDLMRQGKFIRAVVEF